MKKNYPFILFFIFLFLAELMFGYYLSCIRGFIPNDSISRLANAFYISHSRDPHLGAIGFVWNPLPALMEWVVLLFWPMFPKLATDALAAVLVTSLFAAGTAVLLLRHSVNLGFSYGYSLLFCLLYALNPFIFLYGANGMSEAMFTFFVVLSIISLGNWLMDSGSSHTIVISLAMALAFLIRYEAVAFSAAMACGFLIAIWFLVNKDSRAEQSLLLYSYRRAEGTLVVLMSPILYACLIWMFLNYMIMNDPLYFYRSTNSNLSLSETVLNDGVIKFMIGNPLEVIKFIIYKSSFFSFPLAVIVLFRIWKQKLFHWDILILLIILCSIPSMQFAMLLKGTSYGWLRFFFYTLPILAAWIPYEIKKLNLNYKLCLPIHMIGLLLTAGITGYAMSNPNIASEEYDTFQYAQNYQEQQYAKQIAEYINANLPGSLIIMDSLTDFQVILNAGQPRNLIIPSDRDFQVILREPKRYGAAYILSTPPRGKWMFNEVNKQYPGLYENGGNWVSLVQQFGDGRKLYKITADPPKI